MPDDGSETWLSIGAAAAKLGCSRQDIQSRVDDDTIPCVQTVGKTWVNVQDLLESQDRPPGGPARKRIGRLTLAWSLALVVTVASAIAGTWGWGRINNLKTRLNASQSSAGNIQQTLQLTAQDLQQTSRLLQESKERIQHLNATIDAIGKETAQRDAVAQAAHAKLRAHNEQLNSRIARLESELSRTRKLLAEANPADPDKAPARAWDPLTDDDRIAPPRSAPSD